MNEQIEQQLVELLKSANAGAEGIPELAKILVDDVARRGMIQIGFALFLIAIAVFLATYVRCQLMARWKREAKASDNYDAAVDPIVCGGLILVTLGAVASVVSAVIFLQKGLEMWAAPSLWLLENMLGKIGS